MPDMRVPALMMHMAGLRQEQWGRRNTARALGFWHADADAVAPNAWVSARSLEAAKATTPDARRAAWRSAGRILVTEGVRLKFGSMGEYDHWAARYLLLALMLRRHAEIARAEIARAEIARRSHGDRAEIARTALADARVPPPGGR